MKAHIYQPVEIIQNIDYTINYVTKKYTIKLLTALGRIIAEKYIATHRNMDSNYINPGKMTIQPQRKTL